MGFPWFTTIGILVWAPYTACGCLVLCQIISGITRGEGVGVGGGDIEHSDSSQRLADHDVMMTLTLTRNTMSYKL